MLDSAVMAISLDSAQTTLLADVIASLGTGSFGAGLLAFIRTVVNLDSAVAMAYPSDSRLVVLHDELDTSARAGFDGPYRKGLYMLSPLYINARNGRQGCFHISDIAPEGFTESEFYKLYYSTNGCIDQMAYFLETANGTPIAMSLERTPRLPAFNKRERTRLKHLVELVAPLVKQHRWPNAPESEPTPPGLHAHLQSVMRQFGSSTLTLRERDVVRLVLRGHSSKSVAKELSISTQTEQVHRKNIYQKLGISSHSELFTLLFDAIALPRLDGDPVLALRGRERGCLGGRAVSSGN